MVSEDSRTSVQHGTFVVLTSGFGKGPGVPPRLWPPIPANIRLNLNTNTLNKEPVSSVFGCQHLWMSARLWFSGVFLDLEPTSGFEPEW